MLLPFLALCLIGWGCAFLFLGLLFEDRYEDSHCASCGYSLRGLTLAAGRRCPECGSDVSGPGSTTLARTTRSTWCMYAGLVTLAVGVWLALIALSR